MANRRNITYKIGITGNICTGKSLVLNFLKRYGVNTLDPKEAALNLLSDNPLKLGIRLTEHFGPDVIDSRGRLSRKKLAGILYKEPEKRIFLEQTLTPVMREEIKRFLYSPMGTYIRAVEAPNLLEEDTGHLYDEVWVVITETTTQIERLMQRDQLAAGEASYLVNAQWPQSRKMELGHRVIDNSKDIHQTENQVRKVLDEINHRVFKVGL
ncbi:MAG: coaE [Vampirovibrio sp.]|jgi:dephospho-CoA kinase|nr:coaE [Vampirovibrio sp.]